MPRSFPMLLAGWCTIGWICGATGIGAQEASNNALPALSSASEERSLATLGQPRAPWWTKDMRLHGAVPSAQADLRAIMAENRQRQALKSLLGDRRWRSLDGARFAMEVDALGFTRDPEKDRVRQGEIENELRRNFYRLARETVEARFRLEDRAERYLSHILPDRWAAKAEGEKPDARERPLGMSVSPRLSYGHGARVGMKMRPTGGSSPLLRNAWVSVERDFHYDDTRVVLGFEHALGDRDLYLEYRSDDARQGQYLRLSVRFSY